MTTLIVGGGLGGALTARALDLRGEDVVVVDAAAEPGGVTVPVRSGGYLLEPAAGTVLLPDPHLVPLLEGLDLKATPAGPVARRRFVHHRGRTVEVVPGPGVIATPLLSPRAKLRILAEPFIGRSASPEESLEGFLQRRLGAEAGRLGAWLMSAGVQAGDPARLVASRAFPMLTALEAGHGSLLRGALAAPRRGPQERATTHIIEGGTARIAGAVADALGDRWLRSWPVTRLEPTAEGWRVHGPGTLEASRVVTAVRPSRLAEIYPPLAPILEDSEAAPVAVVWLGLSSPELPEGIGALVGPEEGFATLGFLYESSYAPARAPGGRGLVKAIVGGAPAPGLVDLDDYEVVRRVTAELGAVLGTAPQVEMSHVVRHRPGIPQYTVSHGRMIDRVREELPPGLAVTGWAFDGVGVSRLAAGAVRTAAAIA